MHKYSMGVVGASGYSGIELCRVLAAHPAWRSGSSPATAGAGTTVRASDRHRRGGGCAGLRPSIGPGAEAARDCDAVLLATPAEASLELAPGAARRAGMKVIDLSGAFRLADPAAYPSHYGFDPPAPRRCSTARSTACPSCDRDAIARRAWSPTPAATRPRPRWPWRRCSGRGSSPTESVVIDAASGVTGAGRQGHRGYSFCEVADDFRAYKVLRHQHTPEIAQTLSRGAGGPVRLTFTPHLLPRQARHPRHRVGAARLGRRRAGAGRGAPAPTPRAVRRRARLARSRCTSRRWWAPTAAPAGRSRSDGDPGGWWSSPRSTTCSRAPPGRRCRTSTSMLGLERRPRSSSPGGPAVKSSPGLLASPASTPESSRSARTSRWCSARRPARPPAASPSTRPRPPRCWTPSAGCPPRACTRSSSTPATPTPSPAPGGWPTSTSVRRRAGAALRFLPRRCSAPPPASSASRLPVPRRSSRASPVWSRRSRASREPAAEAIMTTDTRIQAGAPLARLGGREVTVPASARARG